MSDLRVFVHRGGSERLQERVRGTWCDVPIVHDESPADPLAAATRELSAAREENLRLRTLLDNTDAPPDDT